MTSPEQLAIQRDLGRMEAQISALSEKMSRVVEELTEVKKELGEVKSTLSERRGSWKVIASLSGLIGAIITGVIVKLIPLIPWR